MAGDSDPENNLRELLLGEARQKDRYIGLKRDVLGKARQKDLPDGHLLLGVRKTAMRKFANTMGFPKQYCRQAVFADLGEPDWISRAYGTQLTGYDFAAAIRHWLKQQGKEELSVAEVLIENGEPGVGMATCFVSHVQSQHIHDTLEALECNPGLLKDTGSKKGMEGEYFWLDYMILRQCQSDFNPDQIHTVLSTIRYTLAVEDEERTYLTRSFCLMELAMTPSSCLWVVPSTSRRHEVRKGRRAAVRKYCKQFVLTVPLSVMTFVLLCFRACHDAASLLHGFVGWTVASIVLCCLSPLVGIGSVIIIAIIVAMSVLYDPSYLFGMLFIMCILLAAIAPFIVVFVNVAVSLTSFVRGEGCDLVFDAAAATARRTEDKRKIDDFIVKHWRGGFQQINGDVERAYKHALGVGAASVTKAILFCVDELKHIVYWPVERFRLAWRRCVSRGGARRM